MLAAVLGKKEMRNRTHGELPDPVSTTHPRRWSRSGILGAPVAVMATPTASVSTPPAACTGGEEEDVYTTTCVPFLVPNSPEGFSTTAANPDVPEIEGVPCTGNDSGACLGLAE